MKLCLRFLWFLFIKFCLFDFRGLFDLSNKIYLFLSLVLNWSTDGHSKKSNLVRSCTIHSQRFGLIKVLSIFHCQPKLHSKEQKMGLYIWSWISQKNSWQIYCCNMNVTPDLTLVICFIYTHIPQCCFLPYWKGNYQYGVIKMIHLWWPFYGCLVNLVTYSMFSAKSLWVNLIFLYI